MVKPANKSLQFIKQLNTMLNAQMTPWIVTHEEERFFRLFRRIAVNQNENRNDLTIYSWSLTEGLLNLMPFLIDQNGIWQIPTPVMATKTTITPEGFSNLTDAKPTPITTLRDVHTYIKDYFKDKIYIIKDIHNILNNNRQDYAENVRRLKDIIFLLREKGGNIIFLGPELKLPIDFENDITALDMPRPDDKDIDELLNMALSGMTYAEPSLEFCIDYINNKGKTVKSKHPNAALLKEKFIYNLRGLTDIEISQILSFVCVKNSGLTESTLEDIKESKKEKISKLAFLEFIHTSTEIPIGGHKEFKQYINQRGLYLNKKYRETYNLKAPKGLLAVGPTGCGKSVMAKYVAWTWNVPLIRLDFSAIFGKYLGESETHLREALKIAEANAPCVLWIDELEKAIGNLGSSDSGTTMRIFGKLLTWMAERKEMVYLYCTANNISAIPAEFLRTGRFDTVQWADLPTLNECQDIINIHIKLNGISLSEKEINYLATIASDREMTGAEIEHAIISANFNAALESSKLNVNLPVTSNFIEAALHSIRPYAESHKDELMASRRKALKNYEFTSAEVKAKIEKIILNNEAIQKEFEN